MRPAREDASEIKNSGCVLKDATVAIQTRAISIDICDSNAVYLEAFNACIAIKRSPIKIIIEVTAL